MPTTMRAHAFRHEGPGPAILLFHGFTGTPFELRPLGDALAARGVASVAPLLPGHGTDPRALSPLRWRDFRAAAREAFDALCAERGAIFVGGLSMGALLALDLALDPATRDRVRAVLTYGCALRLGALATGVLAGLRALGPALPEIYLPKRGLDVRDAGALAGNPAYRTSPLRAARELLAAQDDVRARLATLRAPLLAFHGLLDRTCPLEASIELVRAPPASEAALVVLPRSGHLVTVDHDREEVARQSVAFVLRLATPR